MLPAAAGPAGLFCCCGVVATAPLAWRHRWCASWLVAAWVRQAAACMQGTQGGLWQRVSVRWAGDCSGGSSNSSLSNQSGVAHLLALLLLLRLHSQQGFSNLLLEHCKCCCGGCIAVYELFTQPHHFHEPRAVLFVGGVTESRNNSGLRVRWCQQVADRSIL